MDQSFTADGGVKGSYYRRIEDIARALDALRVSELPPAIQFLAYYFACEKLALAIVGIQRNKSAKVAYEGQQVRLGQLKQATRELRLSMGQEYLESLFSANPLTRSARVLRNKLVHELGPTHVKHIVDDGPSFIPKMKQFLGCAPEVLAHLRKRRQSG